MVKYCMYKKTPPQMKLFGVETQVSRSLRGRLESSWAHLFRCEVLPLLCRKEDDYAMLYGKTGRPNFSVARLLGLCLLQEWNDLSDQEALDTFSFDMRWRYALDVSDEEDYLSRRSLVEFRRRLAAKDPEMKLVRTLFESIRDSALRSLGLSTSNQRLDSTHIISNIRLRGRVALFSNTLSLFLKSLDKDHFSRVPAAIQEWHATEPEGWFGLGPAEQKIKLEELAQYLHELIVIFEKDELGEPYQLLTRLFSDQSECSHDNPEESSRVQVKKKTEGPTLQSPYDPDASCGHKGPGYSLHITETCNNPKAEIITDYEVHGAARSDIAKALSVIERLETAGLKPDALFADGGYPSVPSALKIKEQDIEFITPVNRSRLSDDVVSRDHFHFDPEGCVTQCPMGHSPIDHRILSANNRTGRSLYAIFDGSLCRSCAMLDRFSGTGSQPSGTGVPAARYRRGLPSGDHPRASPSGSYVCPPADHRMEGPVQDPRGDRGNELRAEAGSWHRQASGTSTGKGILCRGMQGDRLQHKEMGQGLIGLGKAHIWLHRFHLPCFKALVGRF